MAADPLDQVLRLVAEGRLTADEAAPILAALDGRPAGEGRPAGAPRTGPAAEPPSGTADGARSLRVEVREAGRTVVNLRLPLALGRYAIDRIPGLSADQVARLREALSSGMTGPVLVVDDESDSVRIEIE
jgi:hypothetical protein